MTVAHHRFAEASKLSEFLRDTAGDATVVPGLPRPLPKKPAASDVAFADIGEGLKSVLEYTKSDQVISVECGIKCGELRSQLASNHHWLPVTAGDDQTLLEIIISGDAGELEHGFGGPRDLVLGLEVMLADGSQIKTGGKVVKNVTGYDTSKLFVGSHGWFGIPLSAHLRLYALPQSERTLLFEFTTADDSLIAVQRLLSLGLPFSCCEVISAARIRQKGLTADAIKDNHSYLALQIHGHPQVVDEIADDAQRCVGTTTMPQTWQSEEGTECPIWQRQSDHAAKVTMTLPLTGMRQVLRDASLAGSAWQARPWRGSLTFYIDEGKTEDVVLQLKSSLPRIRLNSSLAYATDAHWLHVERVPERDTAADLIKDELKKRFDPAFKLNKLVHL